MKSKKLIIFLLIISLMIVICGCSNSYQKNDIGNTENTEGLHSNSEITEESTYTNLEVEYLTFEECLSLATHIMSATYTGEYETHGIYRDLIFSLEKQYKGSAITDIFHLRTSNQTVSVAGTDIVYSESPSNYQAGKTYLLVLEQHISVYYPYDLFLSLGNINILDDDVATMYNGSNILSHSNTSTENIDIISYINDYLKTDTSSPAAIGIDFVRSNSLNDIVSDASFVAKVTPFEYIGGSQNNDTERYVCKVDEVMKGTADENTIKIIFMEGTIEIGAQYIVMCESLGASTYYILSSKNSVYPISNAEKIQQIHSALSDK